MNRFILVLVGSFLLQTVIFAQANKKKSFVRQSGQVSISYNGYDAQAINYPTFRPRYESNIMALNANYNIQIGKYFSLPFGVHISNRKKSYNLPELPQENLVTYVQNPRNNIHIDPTYKWAKLHLGTHTPQYSTLTTGNIQVFGAGFELTPGKFILSGNYGKSQIAIEPDSLLNIQGAYRQELWGARIGFGDVNGSKFTLNLVKVQDDPTSVIQQPIGLTPAEGLTFSPLVEFKLGKKIKIKTETSGSAFTQNTLSDSIPFHNETLDMARKYFTINALSKFDVAHESRIDYQAKHFGIGGEVKFVGPGYRPAGYYAMETDYLDYKVNTKFDLLKKKINFVGTIGLRTNNVRQTIIQTTQRIIGATSLKLKLSKAFSIMASYANFGMNNNSASFYQRVEYVNNSIRIAPTLRFKRPNVQHQISAGWKKGKFKQFDVNVLDYTNRNTQSFNANYRARFKQIPLTVGLSGLYSENKSTISNFNLMNMGLNLSYKLFNKKLKPSLTIAYSQFERDGFSPSKRVKTQLKMKYKVNKKLNIKMGYTINWNRYGTARPGAELIENKFQTTISKKF